MKVIFHVYRLSCLAEEREDFVKEVAALHSLSFDNMIIRVLETTSTYADTSRYLIGEFNALHARSGRLEGLRNSM